MTRKGQLIAMFLAVSAVVLPTTVLAVRKYRKGFGMRKSGKGGTKKSSVMQDTDMNSENNLRKLSASIHRALFSQNFMKSLSLSERAWASNGGLCVLMSCHRYSQSISKSQEKGMIDGPKDIEFVLETPKGTKRKGNIAEEDQGVTHTEGGENVAQERDMPHSIVEQEEENISEEQEEKEIKAEINTILNEERPETENVIGRYQDALAHLESALQNSRILLKKSKNELDTAKRRNDLYEEEVRKKDMEIEVLNSALESSRIVEMEEEKEEKGEELEENMVEKPVQLLPDIEGNGSDNDNGKALFPPIEEPVQDRTATEELIQDLPFERNKQLLQQILTPEKTEENSNIITSHRSSDFGELTSLFPPSYDIGSLLVPSESGSLFPPPLETVLFPPPLETVIAIAVESDPPIPDGNCVKCGVNKADILLLPCRHVAVCAPCWRNGNGSDQLSFPDWLTERGGSSCPKCGQNVTESRSTIY